MGGTRRPSMEALDVLGEYLGLDITMRPKKRG